MVIFKFEVVYDFLDSVGNEGENDICVFRISIYCKYNVYFGICCSFFELK